MVRHTRHDHDARLGLSQIARNKTMNSFNGKVAAITGAGSGIGRALALQLASEGCALALSDINLANAEETARLASKHTVKITSACVDVSKREQVLEWAANVVADHGRVNLIFNNAGVAHAGSVEGSTFEDYEWIVGINFWGVVNGTKAFLPFLKQSGDGHIINLSSVFGLFAQPGMGSYNATKYAVRGFTESLRMELDMTGCGVSATCVHPGGIRTNIANDTRMSQSMHELLRTDKDIRKSFHNLLLTQPPEKAARAILNGVRKNKRRVLIGSDAASCDLLVRALPAAYQFFVVRVMNAIRN
jgi:short-subunit dehydrogenase